MMSALSHPVDGRIKKVVRLIGGGILTTESAAHRVLKAEKSKSTQLIG